MSDILLVKLSYGEDVIAEIGEASNEEITILVKPMQVGITEKGVAMMPWMVLSAKEYFIINNRQIITMTQPIDELIQKYIEITGKLIVPESRIITPKMH